MELPSTKSWIKEDWDRQHKWMAEQLDRVFGRIVPKIEELLEQIHDDGVAWEEDPKAWHLEERCSPVTRELFLGWNDLLLQNFELEGPDWGQRNYVAYRVGKHHWVRISTRPNHLRVSFFVHVGVFESESVATSLGLARFDRDKSLSEKLSLPSSVLIRPVSSTVDRVTIRVKEGFDVQDARLLAFMKQAYERARI